MYLPVMFCVILVAEAAAVRLQTSRDQSSDQNYITAALIRSTKLKGSWDNFKMFQKSGGAKQAKEDFRSLNPTNVETYAMKQYGEVGDVDIIRTLKGKPMLSIESRKTMPDGSQKIIMRRIEYTD